MKKQWRRFIENQQWRNINGMAWRKLKA